MICLSTVSTAHRGHGCWTDVVWAEDRFEITHRIHLADVIRLMEKLDRDSALNSPESLARLSLYVEGNFGVSGMQQGTWETLGAEIDDDFLYVYQEWATDLPSEAPSFYSSILEDIEAGTHTYIHLVAPGLNITVVAEKADQQR